MMQRIRESCPLVAAYLILGGTFILLGLHEHGVDTWQFFLAGVGGAIALALATVHGMRYVDQERERFRRLDAMVERENAYSKEREEQLKRDIATSLAQQATQQGDEDMKLSNNLPPGALHDPRAPYNQPMIDPEPVDENVSIPIEEAIHYLDDYIHDALADKGINVHDDGYEEDITFSIDDDGNLIAHVKGQHFPEDA